MGDLHELPQPELLTPSQRRVAKLVREGLYHREIAHILGTTPKDVKAEINTIYRTLGLADLLTLAFYVDRHRNEFYEGTVRSDMGKTASRNVGLG